MAWVSDPERGVAAAAPDPAALDGLIGLDVHEAARRANAGGWSVRAFEPGAILTADYRPERVNLVHGDDGAVLQVSIG
jgi:hypothetical protein